MSSIIQNKFHHILGDAARTTKFNFVLPQVSGQPEMMDHIIYSVKSLTLPTMEHTPLELRHKGLPIPIRGVTKFSQNFTVTFYLSETHITKRFFEEWMMMIEQRHYYYDPRKQAVYQRSLNKETGDKPPYMTWYNTSAFIEQYDFDGMKPTAIYEIFNVFPIRVDAPQYSYDSMGQIAEFTVTFACSHFKLHSKAMKNGKLQNQLYHTTNRWSLFGDTTVRGQNYISTEGEYAWDEQRFKDISGFNDLDQTPQQRQEIYWRPYELARWDNMWNRWREIAEGANRARGPEPKKIDHDAVVEQSGDIWEIVSKKYKTIGHDTVVNPGAMGY